MSIRSTFGMDGFDLAVHLLVTFFAVMALGPGLELNPAIALGIVPMVSLILLAWRRKRGLATMAPEATGEVEAARVYELEARVAELEALQERFLELEERVDFAERLITRDVDAQRLGKGSP
jgi:type VI protein secretion system component VasK